MADRNAKLDRGESLSMMEPMFVAEASSARRGLNDAAIRLASASAAFSASLPDELIAALAALVRSMNCYYSNLIEGHDTHPISIERALAGDYSSDKKKRDLQLEAKAHIAVQRWIDENPPANPYAADFICEIHRRFYQDLPDDLRAVDDPSSGARIAIVPGALRTRDVEVGRHVAASSGAVPRFLGRFESFYGDLGLAERIAAMGAAHHRLMWIHPFPDGNGRVGRLMSHAVASATLDSKGLWSIARGLARNASAYKERLAAADLARRNDLDGRGALSEEKLADFSRFFLEICADQISFMKSLMEPEKLRRRIEIWARDEIAAGTLSKHARPVLERLTFTGSLRPAEIASLLDLTERQTRRIILDMIAYGILKQAAPGAPVGLAFPAKFAHRWLPNLFPEIES